MTIDELTQQVELLKAQLETQKLGNPLFGPLSPMRPRQLHDLRLLPTADDPRPTFFWSADTPRNQPPVRPPAFPPRLMWHKDTHKEITVKTPEEQARKAREGYQELPPDLAPLSAEEIAQRMFEALSPEDQALVLEMQQKARLERVNAALAGLTDGQAAAVMGQPEPEKRARKKSA